MGDMLPYYSLTVTTKKLKLRLIMRTKGGILMSVDKRCCPKSRQLLAGAVPYVLGAAVRAISYHCAKMGCSDTSSSPYPVANIFSDIFSCFMTLQAVLVCAGDV